MKNIAVIGSGISGLTAAHLLNDQHNVQVFEVNDYIGGHTATIDVELDGHDYSIDTGFIVFNDRTYPNFLKLMSKIGVGKQETEMSFSVRNSQTGLEYNGHDLNTLFSQRKNIVSPKFWKLIYDIVRFNKKCKQLYEQDEIPKSETLDSFLRRYGFSDFFSQHYILPMGAAIWSSSIKQMKQFPLRFFIRFFYHHGLLNIADRPQWYVVPGGSRSYIPKLISGFKNKIQLSTKIKCVQRRLLGVAVMFKDGSEQIFDDVILACHSDQALTLIDQPTPKECEVLGDIPYCANDVVLHTDTNLLPKEKLSWASWNYWLSGNDDIPAAVTYDMNILMGLETTKEKPHTFCVTLNQTDAIDPDKILRKFVYHHPVFNPTSFSAQQKRHEICGVDRIHFAGAYWYNGFHEDGVRSGLDVAKRFGAEL